MAVKEESTKKMTECYITEPKKKKCVQRGGIRNIKFYK